MRSYTSPSAIPYHRPSIADAIRFSDSGLLKIALSNSKKTTSRERYLEFIEVCINTQRESLVPIIERFLEIS